MKRLAIGLVLSAVAAIAQVPSGLTTSVFTAYKETTGTAEKVTIQQPATGSRKVRLKAAYVYCSAGCEITQSRNGTAATTTALTPVPNNPDLSGPAATKAFHTSNVGAGTQIGSTVTALATVGQSFDLDGTYMIGDGTGINYTIAVTGASGTIRIAVKWEEF